MSFEFSSYHIVFAFLVFVLAKHFQGSSGTGLIPLRHSCYGKIRREARERLRILDTDGIQGSE